MIPSIAERDGGSTAEDGAASVVVSLAWISRLVTPTEGLNTRSRSVYFKGGGSTR